MLRVLLSGVGVRPNILYRPVTNPMTMSLFNSVHPFSPVTGMTPFMGFKSKKRLNLIKKKDTASANYKLKTHQGCKKRFRFRDEDGEFVRSRASRHKGSKKNSNNRQCMRAPTIVHKNDKVRIRRSLPYMNVKKNLYI